LASVPRRCIPGSACAPGGQRCGELRPTIESISAFAGFDLHELANDLKIFCLGKPGDGVALGFDAEARSTLAGRGNAVVGDGLLHSDKLGSA
jgi:hypothetical protein